MVLAMSALFHTEWREAIHQSNPFPETATLQWTRFTCRDKHGVEHPGYMRGPGWAQPQDVEPMAADVEARFSAAQPGPAKPPAGVIAPVHFAGATQLHMCDRLLADWQRLADMFEIALAACARFERGREPHGIWEWLETRQRLGELAATLEAIGS